MALLVGVVGFFVLKFFGVDPTNLISDKSTRGDSPVVKLGVVFLRIFLAFLVPLIVGVVSLSIPAYLTYRVYNKWFFGRDTLFWGIIFLIVAGIGLVFFAKHQKREKERAEVLNIIKAIYLDDRTKPIRYVIKAGAPLNCSFEFDMTQSRKVEKNSGDMYTIVSSLKIEKESVNWGEKAEHREACREIYKQATDVSEIRSQILLEDDNRTVVDLSDKSIYTCIPVMAKEQVCKTDSGMMTARTAADGCIEITDRSFTNMILESYDCPREVVRSIDIPVYSAKGKVPIDDKPGSPEASLVMEKFRRP